MATATKAAVTTTANPKTITIRGRVSFPRWTYKEAVEMNKKSKFVKANEADVSPEFNLLVEQAQLDKLVNHLNDVFIPYMESQFAKGEKRDAMDPKYIKKIQDFLAAGDWTDTPPNTPIKAISEKNQPNAPECVASLKVIGSKGVDIDLKATVWNEEQLLIPDPDILSYPVQKPIKDTVFTPYAGAYFIATLNLFSYWSSNSVYGISASANVAFYMGNLEGERFGGGAEVDLDEIFMD